jgi:hypothetical protein
MRSTDDVRARLAELQRLARECDYYDPYATYLRGEIAALEWVLAEREPRTYSQVSSTDEMH